MRKSAWGGVQRAPAWVNGMVQISSNFIRKTLQNPCANHTRTVRERGKNCRPSFSSWCPGHKYTRKPCV